MNRIKIAINNILNNISCFSFVLLYVFLANILLIYKVNFVLEPMAIKSKFIYISFCALSSLLSSFALGFLLQLFCNMSGKKLRKILSYLFCFIYSVVFLFDAYVVELYSSPMTSNIMLSIVSTNWVEAKEYFADFRYTSLYKYVFYLILCIVVSLIMEYRLHNVVSRKIAYCKIIFLLVYLLLFFPRINPEYGVNGVYYWGMNSVERFIYSYVVCNKDLADINKNISKLKNHEFRYIRCKKKIDSLNVVVIQGESLRRNSMHCYGAIAENTPNIDSMIKSGELVLFEDCVASGANTVISVPRIFSFYNNYRNGVWSSYPTIVNAMKKLDFYTMWISNQDKGGKHANAITALAMITDSVSFTQSSNAVSISSATRNYDEEIIPLLPNIDDAKKNGKDNLFVVIHLMGQHEKFFMRYPKEFDVFKSKVNDRRYNDIAEYYNSILYGDYIFKKIVEHFKDSNTIIFFTSDHGINLYDDPSNPTSNGHAANKYASPVPFIVFMTEKFRTKNPELYNSIKRSRKKSFSNDILPETICDALSIETEYSDERFELFSDKYKNPEKRKILGFNSMFEITEIYNKADSIYSIVKTR